MKITIILTALFLISLPSYGSSQSSSPNIVLIIADDVSAEDVGCYGCPGIKTPVMDQLAATGIRFDNGFVTTATCAASRGSIMLGRWPHCTAMPELKAILDKNSHLKGRSSIPQESRHITSWQLCSFCRVVSYLGVAQSSSIDHLTNDHRLDRFMLFWFHCKTLVTLKNLVEEA